MPNEIAVLPEENVEQYAVSDNSVIITQTPQIILNSNQIALINAELRNGNQVQVDDTGIIRVCQTATTSTFTNIRFQNTWYTPTTCATGISLYTGTTSTGISLYTGTTSTGMIGSNYIYYTGGTFDDSVRPWKPKRGPVVKKSIRSSIKKALNLISNFGMEEDVRIFLGGETIEVSHPDSLFKFVMERKKYPNILRATEYGSYSTPFDLSLYTKTDIHIANLCVLIKDTPVLDVLLSIALFIKSGNEQELLSKANFNSLTRDIDLRKALALKNPYLESKLRISDVRINGGIYA